MSKILLSLWLVCMAAWAQPVQQFTPYSSTFNRTIATAATARTYFGFPGGVFTNYAFNANQFTVAADGTNVSIASGVTLTNAVFSGSISGSLTNHAFSSQFTLTSRTNVSLTGAQACFVQRGSTYIMTNGALPKVPWDSEVYNPNSLHSLVTNPERITIAVTGKYIISVYFDMSASVAATGSRIARLYKNGAQVVDFFGAIDLGNLASQISISSFMMSLTAGDYIEVGAYQTSGANINLIYPSQFSVLQINP